MKIPFHKIIVILCLSLNVLACSNMPHQEEENNSGVVGIALGDSTTATVGSPSAGVLIGDETEQRY